MTFILSIVLITVSFVIWRNARQDNNVSKTLKGLALVGMTVFAGFAIFKCFTQVPAGHVGVVDFFGIVSSRTISAGIHPVNPLASVIKLSIQTKEHKETMEVLSREGLTIGLEISALYRLDPDSAARVYKILLVGIMKQLFSSRNSVQSAGPLLQAFRPAHYILLNETSLG